MVNCQIINLLTSLFILVILLWTVLQIYAFSSSSSRTRLTHLTNSKGEVCGESENEGRKNLLYFDISKCAGLKESSEDCKSAKVRILLSCDILWGPLHCKDGDSAVTKLDSGSARQTRVLLKEGF